MKGQDQKPTTTCEWITFEDVSEDKCPFNTAEEFLKPENLKKMFDHRCNLILQRLASSLGQKMMAGEEDPFDVWNAE